MKLNAIVGMAIMALSIQTTNPAITVPEDVKEYTECIAGWYDCNPYLLQALIFVESSFDEKAENGDCKGYMQVSEKWHKDRIEKFGISDIEHPYNNILVGTDYLMELVDKYDDMGLALDVYNGNSNAFTNYKNGIKSPYAQKIMRLSEELEEQDELSMQIMSR